MIGLAAATFVYAALPSAPVVATLTCMSLKVGRNLEMGSVSWMTPSSTSIIAATEASGLVIE